MESQSQTDAVLNRKIAELLYQLGPLEYRLRCDRAAVDHIHRQIDGYTQMAGAAGEIERAVRDGITGAAALSGPVGNQDARDFVVMARPKRGRKPGRPTKASAAAEPQVSAPPKRRGRPPKASASITALAKPAEASTPKARRRKGSTKPESVQAEAFTGNGSAEAMPQEAFI